MTSLIGSARPEVATDPARLPRRPPPPPPGNPLTGPADP